METSLTRSNRQFEILLPGRRTDSPFVKLLGDFLSAANSGLLEYERERFLYPLKRRILATHGTFEGYQVQTIRHLCNCCDGTGWWHYWRNDADRCEKCGGTGTHHRTWHLLETWRLGGRLFHSPVRRAMRLGRIGKPIKGLVRHAPVNPSIAVRSLFFLLLVFDQSHLVPFFKFRWTFGRVNSFLSAFRCDVIETVNAVDDWCGRIGLVSDMIVYDQTHPWIPQ